MKKAVILDTSAIIYRSFHALKNMRNSKGTPTGATYGFVNTLESIVKELNPDFLAACLDVRRSELKRTEEFEEYKAHREKAPEELIEQQEYIMEILDAYKIPKYKIAGYEADDLMSTLATRFSEDRDEEIEVFVVTKDKDLSQLVNDRINIVLLGEAKKVKKDRNEEKSDEKGKKKQKAKFTYIRTAEDVVDYLGVTPEEIPELFGLMGDASDGIPGVRGIGPAKGVKLIEKYSSLEKLYENIEEIKGKDKENLIASKDLAFLSRKLATVHKDVEIEYDKEKLKLKERDLEKLLAMYRRMEFKKMTSDIEKEMRKAGKLSSLNTGLNSLIFSSNENIGGSDLTLFGNSSGKDTSLAASGTHSELFEKIPWEAGKKIIADMESKAAIFENGFGIAVSDSNKNIALLYDELKDENDRTAVFSILSEKEITGYNIKEIIKKGIRPEKYFDIMLAWYVLGTESSHDLENIIFSELEENLEKFGEQFKKRGAEEITEEEKTDFIWKRAFCLRKLEERLNRRLENEGLKDVFENLESQLVPVLANMELNGIKINQDYFSEYKVELKKDIAKLEEEIYGLSGEEFNIASPKQLSEILFEKMGIEPVKKTKTGYSTDVEVLEALALRGIEIAEKLLEYRGKTKLLSTYVEPIPKLADSDSRIHTTFNQNGTATGRLSSTNPNIQNIPVRTEEGIKIRRGFVARDGWSLISFDYSQIELRVLAEMSKDDNLVAAYKDDKDLHDLTARKLFAKADDEAVTREQRSIAKVINFSILYGKTPFGLSKELKIPMEDASRYIRKYFGEYPKVKEFLDNVLEDAELNGFVETLFGTRRYIAGIDSANKNVKSQANRMAVNTVVQGTAANIIKKVMVELYNELKDRDDIKMLLQVHDELIFEAKDESAEKYMSEIKEIMENTVKFEHVKLSANGGMAKNWGELK